LDKINKKYIIPKRVILSTVVVLTVILGATYIYFTERPVGNNGNPGLATADKIEVSASPVATTSASNFTPNQLQVYYKVYQDPFVIHIRKVFTSYLDGSNYGMSEPQLVIVPSTSSSRLNGLSSFIKDYYQSKFIVYSIDNNIAGGKNISIIFQDKPDKLFSAWVFKLTGGTYDLRGFWQNLAYSPEKMKQVQSDFKEFLEDRNHAL